MPSGRNGQPAGSHTLGYRDGVEVVDLTDSDQEDPLSERQAAEDGQPGTECERERNMTLRLCSDSIQPNTGDSTAANDGLS